MPQLSDATLDLPPSLLPVVQAQLDLVQQGLLPEPAFWASWAAMTGRPIPTDRDTTEQRII